MTDHREQVRDALIERGVFGFEPHLLDRHVTQLRARGWTAEDVRLVCDFARWSGKRRLEKVLGDMEKHDAYAHALQAAQTWQQQQQAENAECEARPEGWSPSLRQRAPRRLTHEERLQLIRATAHEWAPESIELFAAYIGVDSVDEANALLAEADCELTFTGRA